MNPLTFKFTQLPLNGSLLEALLVTLVHGREPYGLPTYQALVRQWVEAHNPNYVVSSFTISKACTSLFSRKMLRRHKQDEPSEKGQGCPPDHIQLTQARDYLFYVQALEFWHSRMVEPGVFPDTPLLPDESYPSASSESSDEL